MSVGDYDHIAVVDKRTGEEVAEHPRACELEAELQAAEDVIKGLQRDIRGWSARFENLRRDKAASAKHHPLYGEVKIVFKEWRRRCNHPRSPFTADRFWIAVPFMENEKYGMRMMMRAVAGAEFDPFISTRKNGSVKRHDSWELIYRDADHFEEFVNKAPHSGQMEMQDAA